MSAIAAIAVYDGAATPVLHNLTPVSVTRDKGKVVAIWREYLPSVPYSSQITLTATIERLKSGVWKTEVRVEVPVMESVSGQNAAGYTAAPKVAYVNTLVTTGFFHERSDITGRRLIRQLSNNFMNGLTTTQTVIDVGPVRELVDILVAPT